MADWDETSPADSDIVSQYPANERAARSAVRTNFGVDHREENDADVGKHEVIQITDNAGDPTITAGQVGIWNNAGVLKTRVGAGAAVAMDVFPSGTRMLFWQATAPVGWTRQNQAELADTSIIVRNSGATGEGENGGSWTITGVTVDNHALTIAQLPAHNHGGFTTTSSEPNHNHGGTNNAGTHAHSVPVYSDTASGSIRIATGRSDGFIGTVGSGEAMNSAGSHSHGIPGDGAHDHTFTIPQVGSGNAHNHGLTADGSWRPKHISCMVAEKD